MAMTFAPSLPKLFFFFVNKIIPHINAWKNAIIIFHHVPPMFLQIGIDISQMKIFLIFLQRYLISNILGERPDDVSYYGSVEDNEKDSVDHLPLLKFNIYYNQRGYIV